MQHIITEDEYNCLKDRIKKLEDENNCSNKALEEATDLKTVITYKITPYELFTPIGRTIFRDSEKCVTVVSYDESFKLLNNELMYYADANRELRKENSKLHEELIKYYDKISKIYDRNLTQRVLNKKIE